MVESTNQQYPYAQQPVGQTAPVIESASATTNMAANTSGKAIYGIFAAAVVLLSLLMVQVGGCAGTYLGEAAGEIYEEYGDELAEFDYYEELQSDDPVSPDFSGLLEGEETENT